MQALLGLSRGIDRMNGWLGRASAWLILVAVLISAVNAVVRKVFDTSSNAWLEAQWYLFGAVFLIAASWTLIANEHIRIDLVSNMLSRRTRSWIDLLGHIFFLLPMTIVMLWTTYPFFVRSIAQNEQSTNAGGLPVYPAKFLILLGFAMLFIQAFSEIIKRIAIMRGLLEDRAGGGHHEAAEAEAERLKAALAEESRRREAALAGGPRS
jgi:TRAP-type mannitol/chloroaromatic compound transport system permease small subunit